MRIFARNAAGRKPPPESRPNAGPTIRERLASSTMEAISRGSRTAFADLFDRTAGAVAADLAVRLAEPGLRTAILAATYVEVWWLAGCRGDPDPDVTQWIGRILDRRIADSSRFSAIRVYPDSGPGRAELELADLLGRPVDKLWPFPSDRAE